MIELFEKDTKTEMRQSSKGNQLKWKNAGKWYKADYTGYEGLSEYMVSNLLKKSSLREDEYVLYSIEKIKYGRVEYCGSKSDDFLKESWQIVTLERLFKAKYGSSFYESVWKIPDKEERFRFICNTVNSITGLKKFDVYLNKLFTLDAFFLNEDRHMHNIAVIMNGREEYDYCPIFDNGACLLSDTTMDYPLGVDPIELISDCKAKTISEDFDEQLDISEKLCGINLNFCFDKKDVWELLSKADAYSEEIRQRVENIIFQQMHKYQYLFK